MAGINVDAGYVQQIEKEYSGWRQRQPRDPGQIGGPCFIDVTGGPYPDGTVDRYFNDAFFDELEGSGIPFKRLARR